MGLRTCNDCKNSVSTSAKFCPHCGAAPPKTKTLGCNGVIFIFTALIILGVALGDKQPNAPQKATPQSSDSNIPKLLIKPPQKPTIAQKTLASELPTPYKNPIQYIGLSLQQASKATGVKPNDAGNIIVESKIAKMMISTSGKTSVSYVDVEFLESQKCLQSKDFESTSFLKALGINPSSLELARKQTHYHTYYDHKNKLKIFVACIDDNWPYTVGISKNYYLE